MTVLNFAAETVFEANTTSGNVSLTRVQLETLVDGNYTTGGVALGGTDILALDVDLGNRIATKDLRYYFSSPSPTGAVASGISFYYRDYTTDPWSALTTIYGAGYYTTTSGNFFPREVRVIHTISGTSISGTLREYEVNSNEDIVDYGDDGSLTEKGLTDTPFGTSDPYTIPVYNDGDKSATAYVYIGNTGTDADGMLRISDAQNGTYLAYDDGPTISSDNDDYMWGLGAYSDTTLDNNKLILGTQYNISYSSGWQNIATTLDNEPGPATIAWHSTDPFYSVIYYMHDQIMFKYEIGTNTHISLGSTPRTANSLNYGGTGSMCHDPENNRIYYFVWNTITGVNDDSLYIYYFDIGTGLWSGQLYNYVYGNINRSFTVRTAYFDYPGGTDSLDGVFEAGEKYILMCISSGHNTVYRHYAFKISDNTLHSYQRSGFIKKTGDYTGNFSACGVTVQGGNLDDYPPGTVAVIWAYAGSSNYYDYLNYYPITVSGGAAQNWQAIKHYNIPRDSNVLYINQDFDNRADFLVYDEVNNYLYMASDWLNTQYAYRYELGNNYMNDHYFGNSFFDGNLDNARMYGKMKYYEGYGNFWFMTRFSEEQLWIYFPTALSDSTYKTSGTYTTPILKNQDPTYWYVKSEIPENTQIATTSGVVAPTIEVRSSNTAPIAEDSHNIVMFQENPSDADQVYPMGFDYDGNELWRSDYLGGGLIWYWTNYCSGWCAATNKFYPEGDTSYAVNSIFIWVMRRASDLNRIRVEVINRDGGSTYGRWLVNEGYDSDYRSPTNAVINSQGNTYVLWRGYSGYDDRISILTDTGWWVNNVDFPGDQSTLYSLCLAGEDEDDVWFIKEDENIVYRYSTNLTEVAQIENASFQNLNGVCEDGAGGVWIGDYGGGSTWIHHYDKDGTFIATYDVTDHVAVVWRLAQDYQGGVWLVDSWSDQIARFASNGTLIGKVALFNPRGLNSNPLGAYCMSTTADDTYFIDMDVNLNKTVSHAADIYYTTNGGNWGGAMAASIDVGGYLDTDDIGNDPVWGTGGDLEWSEVGKDTHFLHHQKYHQTRITLRSDGSDTPEVEKISLPPTVELANIPTQGYKNSYLKTVVASGTARSQQSGKLRTWFSLEE